MTKVTKLIRDSENGKAICVKETSKVRKSKALRILKHYAKKQGVQVEKSIGKDRYYVSSFGEKDAVDCLYNAKTQQLRVYYYLVI